MQCYECALEGVRTEAIGLCHRCSVGLCVRHGCVVSQPVTAQFPVVKIVVLPKRARQLTCGVCKAALEQPKLERSA